MTRVNAFVPSAAGIPSPLTSYAARHKLAARFIGGNRLENAAASPVKDFVASHDGHTVITNVLIANNGIAAVKEIRSVRRWAYETFGDERAVKFTVMATPEDLAANSDYIRMADHYVDVPGGTNNNNYANVDLIVDIAERMDVHAVWAGWGHASENPRLPELLAASPKKVIFIGPPASAMRALGDKISSTIVAQHAKVPCIPWSGSGIDQVTVNEEGIVTVDDEVYKKGCVHSWHEGLEKAKGIGFPVMIKASEGGGGKGIRRADQEEGFETLYNAVASEIPGSPIFIMKLAGNARHLEVQLLADQYGNNISLFGRDCSVQRRHQKIIEEAPVTVARPETFQAMERAAVQLGRLVGYVSAGTVEYLYSHTKDEFYFLELNPRLQVEHPTTEMVSGVNLPAAQLQIAMGLPMHRIRDIRQLYSVDRDAASEIEFISQTQQPKPRGHTTACRITSEDPREGFKPSSGMIHDLNFRSSSNVWGYFSVSNNSSIHNFSDSQFGHIFAYGESRSASRKHMIMALKELSIRGDFQTTTEYLIKLLETPAFIDNAISTGWLDELITRKQVDRIDPILAAVCGAVCQAHLASEACISKYRASLEKGHVPARDALKTLFPIDFIYDSHHYTFTATRSSLSSYNLSINDSKCSVGVRALSDTGLLVLLGGQSHSVYWKEDAGAMRLSIDNKTCLIEQQNDPTQLRTPSPGKLVRYTVENKGHIKAGKAFAEIEVMKMYMPLLAQEDGTVQFIKQPGTALNAGDVLGILTLDDPLRVKQAQPFGHLPDLGLPQVVGSKLIQQFTHLHGILKNTLDGFNNQFIMESAFRELTSVLSNPELPFSEWSAEFSALYSRIPQRLIARLMQIIDRARARKSEFPAKTLAKALQKFMDRSIAAGESLLLESTLAPLIKIVKRYREGLIAHKFHVLSGLLEKYTTVEREFSNPIVSDEEVILRLRDANKDDIFKAIQVILSHNNISAKNDLILVILGEYKLSNLNAGNVAAKLFRPALQQLAELESRETATVSLKARQVLIQCALPSVEERAVQLEYILQYSVLEPQYSEMEREHRKPDLGVLRDVVDSSCAIFDVLPILFSHQDPWISLAALEVYVRCAYRTYSLENIQYHNESNDSLCIVSWDFVLRTVAASEPDIETASQLVTPSMPVASTTTSFENGNPLKRMRFICDRSNLIKCPDKEPIRKGVIVPVQYLEEVEEHLVRALEVLPSIAEWNKSCNGTTPDLASTQKSSILELLGSEELLAVCNAVISDAESLDDNKMLLFIQRIVEQNKDQLLFRRVRQLTFICIHKNKGHPGYYTFHGPKYEEDQTIRHCDPALAFQLELERLSNFNIKPAFTKNHTIHIFEAVNKEVQSDKRYFARAVVQHGQMRDEILTVEYFISESSRLIHDILDVLDVLESNCDLNHIFINFSPVFPLQPFEIKKALSGVLEVFRCRLWRLRVTDVEIHIFCTDPLTNIAYPLRVIVSNTSGYVFRVEMYTERMSENGKWLFQSIGNTDIGAFHLLPISTPYPTKNWLQPKRYKAHLMGTQYAYDFPALFEEAVQKSWTKAVRQYPPFAKMQPSTCIDYRELVLDAQDNLFEVIREPGMNTQGIVAWIATARTPEYPHGRRFIIIANDVTFRIGSFGLQEDEFFYKCTEYARNLGIPRIYISANSGARIGMAEELIPYFSVAWNNPKNPEAGFKYLYLTPEVKKRFDDDGTTQDVITEEVTEDGETRHKITMIVGAKDGHGMECLRGSGLIAAVTSRAYEDIFTITLVTCRSVGIGSYLVRLGQRAIQVEGQPIILTGASALNKVLGREVYTSSLQLGGTQIMYKNGVSHLTAQSDFEGVSKIVDWLAFVPDKKDNLLPIGPIIDPWDRDIVYSLPLKQTYDARHLITGVETADGFQSGLFDRDSFIESLGGWAKTVVVGRARLGGIPMGVIAVETRTVENIMPADPANANSTEQLITEAGGVWHPNSAFKTAQAINDFNHGEQLPLMVLANWRGFSGGQKDMYNEILKFGSFIIDVLIKYEQPVFVYIPPFAELRGGSWVVLDPTINPELMEMYADEDSRAGILEPEGVVNVRYRRDKQLKTMARLDPEYRELCLKLADRSLSKEEATDIRAKATAREQLLLPIYLQVSLQFADLHDRAGCMMAKNIIRQQLKWRDARRFFYWRVRRRVSEEHILKQMGPSINRDRNLASLAAWSGVPNFATADREVSLWYEENQKTLHERVESLKSEEVACHVASLLRADTKGGIKGVQRILSILPAEERKEALLYLSQV